MLDVLAEFEARFPRRVPPDRIGLAELHVHVGGSVDAATMWGIAHEQGIRLPTKDYWDFVDIVSVSSSDQVENLADYTAFFHLTERIQSSPIAVERSVHAIVGGAYRHGITLLELRFNPMKRNQGGVQDLDHIVLAAIRGLDRALLEYPRLRAGLIVMMDRTFDPERNLIIVEKAARWRDRGVLATDIAGPPNPAFRYRDHTPHVLRARQAGLGVTIHTGEEGSLDDMWEVVEFLQPDRIGHGILSARDPQLMAILAERGTVLEICPTSNLRTHAVRDIDELRWILWRFKDHGVPFTINTDGPEMLGTTMQQEFRLLLQHGILDLADVERVNRLAHEASFLTRPPRRQPQPGSPLAVGGPATSPPPAIPSG